MAVPLIECTKEQLSMIRFLWWEGEKTREIVRRMTVQPVNNSDYNMC